MTTGLAERQLEIIPWARLRAGDDNGSVVPDDLRLMLFAEGKTAGDAYMRLENPVVAQGNLFECAPAVASVIVAAIADESISQKNLAMALDLLGRIIGGAPDPSEIEAGNDNLQAQCQEEALRGYWSLVKVAYAADSFGADEVAADVLDVLDQGRSGLFLQR